MALALLLRPEPRPGTWRRVGALLSAELSLGLWTAAALFAGLLPALFVASLKGFEAPAWVRGELLLAGLGCLPAALYALKRSLAPILVLEGAGGAEALAGSAGRLRGRLAPFLKAYLPWLAASLALGYLGSGLDLLGLGALLPEPLGTLLAVPSDALALLGLVRALSAL